jgi:hypothetical protein
LINDVAFTEGGAENRESLSYPQKDLAMDDNNTMDDESDTLFIDNEE